MYRRKTYRRKVPKKRTYKRKSYAPKREPIRKIVRREIARNIENKTIQQYNYDRTLVTPQDNSTFLNQNVFPLGPDPASLVINQGTGQANRIGNQIKTKKLLFKGTLVALPYDAVFNTTPRPVQLKMWIFYDKEDPTAVPLPLTNFFQNGNSSKGFQGDLTDLWSPINTDRYRVVASKTFKLGMQEYNTAGGGTSANQFFTNNDFKYNANFSFDLTKHYPQVVKFNDTTATPTTRGLFCMISYASATGGGFPLGSTVVGSQYMQHYEFEDA
ncbi:MAG: capsid protein [Wigfec virus K19_588]|nr:MAG: capsid protein [Wigfec virus K19_588]